MNIGEDISNAEAGGYLILILAALGVVVYIAYEAYQLGESVKTSFCTFFGGTQSDCEASGQSTTNTYSSALNQTITDPIGSIGSILGFNQSGSSVESMSDMTPESGGGG